MIINATGVPVNFITAADWALLWLNDSRQAYTAKSNLLASNKSETGVVQVLAESEIWEYGWGNPFTDSRAPDLAIKPVYGTLYESPGTLEDHGGWRVSLCVPCGDCIDKLRYADDADVPLLVVSGCPLANGGQEYGGTVLNQQVATTLLQALGLPLAQLEGWLKEGTPVLPWIF